MKKSQTEQSKRFIDASRALGCDEDGVVFEKAIKKIASSPPQKIKQKRKVKKPTK